MAKGREELSYRQDLAAKGRIDPTFAKRDVPLGSTYNPPSIPCISALLIEEVPTEISIPSNHPAHKYDSLLSQSLISCFTENLFVDVFPADAQLIKQQTDSKQL